MSALWSTAELLCSQPGDPSSRLRSRQKSEITAGVPRLRAHLALGLANTQGQVLTQLKQRGEGPVRSLTLHSL
jgi:hypothetical protein